MDSMPLTSWFLAVVAVGVIGIAKAGFGGGLGMLATPLCVLAFGPKEAIGILLPLLSAGDLFSMYHYWKKWEAKNLRYLLPGAVLGILIGVQLIGRFSSQELNLAIGILAILFVLFQIGKESILRIERRFAPNYLNGSVFGVASGITSSFAHGAGPVVTMFLVPQKLSKEIFVGTNILIFTWINWLKLPFFIGNKIITLDTALKSLLFLPLIPVGVWLGVWLNRKFSERAFIWVIYAITFLTGLQLIFNFDIAGWFR